MNLISESKKLGLGLLYVFGLIFFINHFKFTTVQIIALLSLINFFFLLYLATKNKFKTINELVLTWFKNCLQISFFVLFLKWINQFGLVGYILSITFTCGWILWRKRKRFVEIKQHIESMLWGKPLKEFIKNKEKPPKIKLTK